MIETGFQTIAATIAEILWTGVIIDEAHVIENIVQHSSPVLKIIVAMRDPLGRHMLSHLYLLTISLTSHCQWSYYVAL